MSNTILEMKGITKKFPGVLALDNVSLYAERGEILALCGENGAGKSTLMKVLSGAYASNSYDGDIYVDGKKVKFDNTAQSEKAGIAMIYQEVNMHLDLTVAENFFMGYWPKKKSGAIDWKLMEKEAGKHLRKIGFNLDVNQIMRRLSTSQHQLIAIARSLSKNPRILVLDEPTSALTESESKRLFDILHNLKEQGITSILITHKLDEMFEHADRVSVLRDGEVVGNHVISETDRNTVVSEMVGREISQFYPKEEAKHGKVVLEAKNISVPHPFNAKINIVEDVSFNVKQGEILGIGGLVGAGRSELVKAVFGCINKNSGSIYLKGREVDIKAPSDAIKHGMALVTEDRKEDGFVGVLKIKENETLAYLKTLCRGGVIDGKRENKEAKKYFDALAIKAPSLDTTVETLSGGNQQKVVLSKWLMTNPKILILDEPTRGIDVGTKYEIYKIMMKLVKQGIAIIMISSELPELISISDRIMVLAKGRKAGEIDARKCTQEDIMHLAT